MRNLLLELSYLGTAYSGWQVQPNAPTVQQTLQDAIEKLFGSRLNVTGCSRTDARVHANEYYCNFRTESMLPCQRVVGGLNAYLPDNIVVKGCTEVPYEFHARYDCKGKEYKYVIHNGPVPDPFYVGRAWHYKYKIDEKLLDSAAQAYVGTHDFSSFCSAGSSVTDTVRTVEYFRVARCGDKVFFHVKADGFLYNMVRIMVGTLTDVSSGRIPAELLGTIIESRDRTKAGITAPPEGLYLNKVFY